MKSWNRQTQCIFCLVRRDLQNLHITVGPGVRRNFSVFQGRYAQDRANRRNHQPETRKHVLDRESKRKGAEFRIVDAYQRGRKDRRDRLAPSVAEDKEKERKAQSEVSRALRHVREFFETNMMSKTSGVSQKKGLDPDGSLWSEFQYSIQQAIAGGAASSKRTGLVDQLLRVAGSGPREDLERELRFAFLDKALDAGNYRSSGVVSSRIDTRYPTEWYSQTRRLQRTIHLHVGPTNSGKTYNALKRLEQAKSGFYAGPLRLLAHEVFSRFNNRGIRCDLITGDDVRLDESGEVELYASTVEMLNIDKMAEVGVVDEIQMMGDIDRGWAWTRAVLGAQVKELHLCGEARVVPLIRQLVASMGDKLHIHQYERLNPLKVMSRSLKGNLQNLRKGDCVVSFSVVNIHAMKRQIEQETGKRCAIVYGSLPPETRAQQAALFNEPDNDYDYLVASDAIGMGLNLSIKRIIFETTSKYNGTHHERISVPQIKQIAGRAGRYRTAQDDKTSKQNEQSVSQKIPAQQKSSSRSIGLVTCLDEADLPVLQHALSSEGTPLKAAGIFPPGELFQELSYMLPEGTPFEYVMRRLCSSVAMHPRFEMCRQRDQLQVARWIEHVENLTPGARLVFCAAPASYSTGIATAGRPSSVVVALAKAVAEHKPITVADVTEIPLEILDEPMTSERKYLSTLEALHKSLILFLWLSYRFPSVFIERDMAVRAKELCEERINETLDRFSANPKLVKRLKEMRKSSETLIQQAKSSATVPETAVTMNPDASVEEIEATGVEVSPEDQDDTSLERKVEVQGELDLGTDLEVKEINLSEVAGEEIVRGTPSHCQPAAHLNWQDRVGQSDSFPAEQEVEHKQGVQGSA